jgi:hypothetical protein
MLTIDSAEVGQMVELEHPIYSQVTFTCDAWLGFSFFLKPRHRNDRVRPMANRGDVKFWKTLDGAKRYCKAKFASK